MIRRGKSWGETQEIFNNGVVSINALTILRGGYCSEHKHIRKSNIFHVLSGRLEVYQWPEAFYGASPDVTVLGAGDSAVVEPDVWHKFRAIEETTCIEIYTLGFRGEDITRRTRGGIDA